MHAFFKVCLVLIFLNTIVEKHILNPEITILVFCINFTVKSLNFSKSANQGMGGELGFSAHPSVFVSTGGNDFWQKEML